MARDIEIVGLAELDRALRGVVNDDMRPMVIREIARKPAQKAVIVARRIQPIGDTGKTAQTIGILRVKNARQNFVEVGYRGRSLGHIYTSAESIVRYKRGTIKGFPSIFKQAGEQIGDVIRKDLRVDLTSVFVRGMRRRGYGR